MSTFEEQATAVAWRDRLRELHIDAYCVADAPLDRFGRGDIYLVVPPEQWSQANEVVENLDDSVSARPGPAPGAVTSERC